MLREEKSVKGENFGMKISKKRKIIEEILVKGELLKRKRRLIKRLKLRKEKQIEGKHDW